MMPAFPAAPSMRPTFRWGFSPVRSHEAESIYVEWGRLSSGDPFRCSRRARAKRLLASRPLRNLARNRDL